MEEDTAPDRSYIIDEDDGMQWLERTIAEYKELPRPERGFFVRVRVNLNDRHVETVRFNPRGSFRHLKAIVFQTFGMPRMRFVTATYTDPDGNERFLADEEDLSRVLMTIQTSRVTRPYNVVRLNLHNVDVRSGNDDVSKLWLWSDDDNPTVIQRHRIP
ncbi:hypothetical protein CBR_g39759 [Chara braunii]|uniref:PB1 domain-containing protein n=1 Tax=Chara braunii TaxID=69332 RepID=A0A388LS90_CHABU|nr:hypothetical protein CBR_g39759 [Chara braunii]|eukprot:GBG85194.1 hypothetical protein CBR_g39759 [Chara braunii]